MSPAGYGTASVALAATPAIVSTFFTHVATWPQRRKSRHAESSTEAPTSIESLPAQQLRYEEGLYVVRSFLHYASEHGVEEVQDFTAQPVPVPHWVRKDLVTIPVDVIDRAAVILRKHLASYGDGKGIELVGGDKWWLIRGRELEAEWIEMTKNYAIRTAQTAGSKAEKRRSWAHLMGIGRAKAVRDGAGGDVQGDRVILYIHGGAFFFASTDMHRYQIQRHARKAGARAFVPNYRLAPQYPFPCGLLDSLAAYLYLISPPEGIAPIAASDIILMGDSAGGGMCLSLLQLIREMGLPMPAAASLMSPWVDLTHSMPSIMEWDGGDYIPSVGFHYKPSAAWPPTPGDGVTVTMPDGEDKLIDEQIQLYCPNKLLTHPLVSPINAGSFGGLCPLYISAGSAELLRDEIIYFAHKAADPTAYLPSPTTLNEYPEQKALAEKYPPTQVHLQVFEGACHVATTLAWTRSAKHIFRGAANFNIWAFNAARKAASPAGTTAGTPDVNGSEAASDSEGLVMKVKSPKSGGFKFHPTPANPPPTRPNPPSRRTSADAVIKPLTRSRPTSISAFKSSAASDAEEESSSESEGEHQVSAALDFIKVCGLEPPFGKSTMVAERVSTHGRITVMEPVEKLAALDPAWRPNVGRVRGDGPVQTWLAKRGDWDEKFGVQLKHWRGVRASNREAASQHGWLTGTLQGENPPLCALVSLADRKLAREVGRSVDEPTTSTSRGVALWMKIGEKADEDAMEGKNQRKRSESWVHKLHRRASESFKDRHKENGHGSGDDKRHSGVSNGDSEKQDKQEQRKSADKSAELARIKSQETRKTSVFGNSPTSPRGSAPTSAIPKVPSSPRRQQHVPPPLAAAASSPSDPVADALARLTVHGTPTSDSVASPLPVPESPTTASTTGSGYESFATADSFTAAESEQYVETEFARPTELSPVMERNEKEPELYAH